MVDGAYAMVPFVSGAYRWPDREKAAELPWLLENDGYFNDCAIAEEPLIASVYDPGGEHSRNPLCSPYWAAEDDLTGLPPPLDGEGGPVIAGAGPGLR
jgi:acetyl esterase